ncbi:MAG: DNA polymerase III subunit beta [Terriglobia bacterium]|jgi:DNA polymerase-3 subunit beta|nr:DNA polymerase III subunit beta [Terriglobia bacterium]
MATTPMPVAVVTPQKSTLFEVSVSKQELLQELQLAQGVTERKTTIPILSNFLLKAEAGRLTVCATDLNHSIQTFCAAAVGVAGSITVPGRKLYDYVRMLPDGNITLKALPNGWVQIRSGRSNTKMVGMDSANYPKIAEFPAAGSISLSAQVMKALLPRIAFAVSHEESRYTLQAALMILKSESISMVATDGHRLALIEKKGESLGGVVAEQKHLIPQIAVSQLMSLLSTMKEGTIDFAADDTNLFFRIQDRVYIARKMTGSFPNYEAVLPKNNSIIVIANVNELTSSIQRVSQFADERSGCVRLTLADNEIKVSSANTDAGESEDVIPAPYSGAPLVVGFNYSYVTDFLKSIAGTEEVRLQFKDASHAFLMQPETSTLEYSYTYVVMPMRG